MPSFRGLLEATGKNQTWLLRIAWVQPSQSLPQAINSSAQRDCLTYPRPQQANSILEQMWSLLTSNLVLLKDQGSSWPSFFFLFYCVNNHSSIWLMHVFSYGSEECVYSRKKFKKTIWKEEFFQIILTFIKVLTCLSWHPSLGQNVACTHLSICTHTHTHTHTPQIPKRS